MKASENRTDKEGKEEEELSSQSTKNLTVLLWPWIEFSCDPYFLSCIITSQFAGSCLHLWSCWFTVTYSPSVEKQVIRQFKYFWLIDWILLLGVHVAMKGQAFVVFRIPTLAVHATVLFDDYHFSACYHEVLTWWWYILLYQKVLRLWGGKHTISNLKGFVMKTETSMSFSQPETDFISIV